MISRGTLLPAIPQRMLQIDETTVADHFSLATSDFCFYIWEYTAGRRYDFSPTNQLISNLKIKPTQITANPRREYYKQQAINHSATALRSLRTKQHAYAYDNRAAQRSAPGT